MANNNINKLNNQINTNESRNTDKNNIIFNNNNQQNNNINKKRENNQFSIDLNQNNFNNQQNLTNQFNNLNNQIAISQFSNSAIGGNFDENENQVSIIPEQFSDNFENMKKLRNIDNNISMSKQNLEINNNFIQSNEININNFNKVTNIKNNQYLYNNINQNPINSNHFENNQFVNNNNNISNQNSNINNSSFNLLNNNNNNFEMSQIQNNEQFNNINNNIIAQNNQILYDQFDNRNTQNMIDDANKNNNKNNDINNINNNINNDIQSNINNMNNLNNNSDNKNFQNYININQINIYPNLNLDQGKDQNEINIKEIPTNNNQEINPFSENYSFSRYKNAAKTGLQNMGKTSYLNSVLQLLGSIRSFASYFLNPKNNKIYEQKVKQYPLSYVIYRLCVHLYPYPEQPIRELYKPDSLMDVLNRYNKMFNNNDNEELSPKILLIYILNQLHQELNLVKFQDKYTFYDFIMKMNIASDRDTVINKGLQFFSSNNNSIIFNYFNWFQIKETLCMNCGQRIYDFLSYPTFELNALEWAKYKHVHNISLNDCLEYYTITKIKKKFCHQCKKYNEVSITTNLYTSPNIFIFLLNLEEAKNDENINFIIDRKINLEKYIETDRTPTNYELTGVIFKDMEENKYKAFCLSPVDKRWYIYDDEKVALIDYDTFMEEYESSIKYKPCVLLYILSKIG